MIDWVNASLPYKHQPLKSGSVFSVDVDGLIEWETHKRTKVVGSFSSSIQIRSIGGDGQGNATYLEFSGNPSKFLQGHNVFGSDDLLLLMESAYLKILNYLNLPVVLSDFKLIKSGHYSISRLDINYMYQLNSRAEVLSWIRSAAHSSLTRHGRPTTRAGTIYWGKNSKRWAIKAYSKAEELKAHPLPEELSSSPISEWSENKLRLELVLRSKEIKQTLNIKYAKEFTIEKIKYLYADYIKRIDMKNKLVLTREELNILPSRLKNTYLLWREGYDCRQTMSRATYCRHRKDLKQYGINIDLEPNSQKEIHSNVIPLIRVLEAEPAQVPEWAYDNNLIFQPKPIKIA